MKYIFSISFLFSLTFHVFSQNASISIKVVDAKTEKAIELSMFRLFKQQDSSLVGGTYADENGVSELNKISLGNYFGIVSFVGYENDTIHKIEISEVNQKLKLPTCNLNLFNIQNIDEIKVYGEKELIDLSIDKKVYNVSEDLTSKGATTNDLLNNIPSVEVDQDGNISLRGNGSVTVLIDGKQSSIAGGNGKSLLDALPAGSIEKIEVITNPSAKYDPDGTAGIINIVLKKNKLRGFNGLLNINAGTGSFKNGNSLDGSFALSYRNSKMNIYGVYAGNFGQGYRNHDGDLNQNFSDGSKYRLLQDRTGDETRLSNTLRFGSDFYINERNTLGFSVMGSLNEKLRTGNQWNSSFDENDSLLNFWNRLSEDPEHQQMMDLNLNYKHSLKSKKGFFIIDANQSFGRDFITGKYSQANYDLDSNQINLYRAENQLENHQKNNISTAQFDFNYEFSKIKGKLETGAKMINKQLNVDTYSESFDTIQQQYYEDTLSNFLYQYNEQIYSAYGQFAHQIKKFKYQVGLRFEQAFQIPNLISDQNKIVNQYFNIFPSVHLSYDVNDKIGLNLGYSKRIKRPSSDELNPFTSYNDPYNIMKGNPFLIPEYIDSYDFGFQYNSKMITISTNVYYRFTKGMIQRLKTFYPNNTTVTMFTNISDNNSFGSDFVLIFKPKSWWKNTLSANYNYTIYDVSMQPGWNKYGSNVNVKYAASFDFWKKTASAQLNVNYYGPRFTVQGKVQRIGGIDLSGEKRFKEGKISLGFKITDLLNTQGFYLNIQQPNVSQVAHYKWMTRKFMLTFSYKFGKLEISNKKSNINEGGGGEF